MPCHDLNECLGALNLEENECFGENRDRVDMLRKKPSGLLTNCMWLPYNPHFQPTQTCMSVIHWKQSSITYLQE